MIKCIIIDDEHLARSILQEMLLEIDGIEILTQCANGFEGLKAIQSLNPDCIFLDVQMPKINGFEMLELLDKKPLTIFTTAFDEYAVQAFEVNAIDYLLKPIEPQRLQQAIEKLKDKLSLAPQSINNPLHQLPFLLEQSQRVVVKELGEIKIIPNEQILFVEASDDYIKIQTKDKYYLKNQTMSRIEQQLPVQQFIRIHRSFIVNSNYIHKIELLGKEQYTLLLTTGKNLPISKTGYIKLKSFLGI
ncbi:MAG TPA: LytTR family transcriptional regulator DNA-binding domain-containing protein [Edaphocola sp.]|nr:LytTR family transcriptional regulator DNA-binding domain-containing protein [Edaphocola sp.]